MSYPNAPDFTPRAALDPLGPQGPFSAWWRYAYSPAGSELRTNVCATTGATVLSRLRGALRLPSNPRRWDADVARGLQQLATNRARSAPGTGWEAVAAAIDPNSATPSRTEAQLGIWLAFYEANAMRLDGVSLDPNAILPQRDAVFEGGDAGLVCFVPGTDRRPEDLSAAELSSVRTESRYGVRLAPGEALVTIPRTSEGPSGPTKALLVALGLGVVALVVWAAPKQQMRRQIGVRKKR